MSSALNLIPVARLEARRRQAAAHRWLVGGAVFVTLLITVSVFVQMRWGGEPADLADALSEATAQTEQTRRQLTQLQAELTAIERRLAANRAVTNQPDYAVLLALLARQLDDELILRSCAFEPIPIDRSETRRSMDATGEQTDADLPPGFTVAASGLAANQRAVSAYVLRLEQTGLFHRVRLVNTRREPTNFGTGRAIAFEIECYLATDGTALDEAPTTQGGEA